MPVNFPRLSLRDLFDADFYRANNPDIANLNDRQAFEHFETEGILEEPPRPFTPFFDLNFYETNNPDVFSNPLIGSNFDIIQDFINNRIDQGRRFSPLVDLNLYRSNSPDLAEFTNRQLFYHLVENGVQEGRRFSTLVDLNFYRANNPDLARLNNIQLFNHFISNGLAEGRTFLPLFDPEFYASRNPDLAAAGVTTNRQLLEHFFSSGLNEGRDGSPFFDVDYYINNNQDLVVAGLTRRQAFEHFQRSGVDENRPFSQFFDANYYLSNNPDLRAQGLTIRQAFNHFSSFGVNEGRRPSVIFDPEFYLRNNPDLAARQLTFRQAFENFQTSGFNLARPASVFFDPNAIAPLVAPPNRTLVNAQGQVLTTGGSIPLWLQQAAEFGDIPAGGVLTYSFVTTNSAFLYEGPEGGVSEVTPAIRNNVRNIMRQFDDLLPISLVEVPDRPPSTGRIRILFSNGPASRNSIGYANQPSDSPGTGIAGDIHLNPDRNAIDFNAGPGSFAYETLLFLVGTALGLEEPDRQLGTSNFEPTLSPARDNNTNTVMTDNSTPGDYTGSFASTPMSYDIRALQYLYGVGGLNANDTVYRFDFGNFIGPGESNGRNGIKQTIWDSGGNDTFDFSALLPTLGGYYFDMSEGGQNTTQIALNGATYSVPNPASTDQTPLPRLVFTTNSFGTTIAFGTQIENLVGSQGDDRILGNDLANNIIGAGGNDIITGGNGPDVLTGGAGSDIFEVVRGDGSTNPALTNVITDFRDGEDFIGLALGLPFQALTITQGTGANANNTYLRIGATGEYLAVMAGVFAGAIDFTDFTFV